MRLNNNYVNNKKKRIMELKKIAKFGGKAVLSAFAIVGISAVVDKGPKEAIVDGPVRAGKKIGSCISRFISRFSGGNQTSTTEEIQGGVEESTSSVIDDVITSPQNNGNFNGRNNGNWRDNGGRENRFNRNNNQ